MQPINEYVKLPPEVRERAEELDRPRRPPPSANQPHPDGNRATRRKRQRERVSP